MAVSFFCVSVFVCTDRLGNTIGRAAAGLDNRWLHISHARQRCNHLVLEKHSIGLRGGGGVSVVSQTPFACTTYCRNIFFFQSAFLSGWLFLPKLVCFNVAFRLLPVVPLQASTTFVWHECLSQGPQHHVPTRPRQLSAAHQQARVGPRSGAKTGGHVFRDRFLGFE